MSPRVIAIDGPAGSGKSTTARAVAERLGLAHLDSGALYRAVTLGVLDAGTPESGDPIVGLARSLPVRLSLVGESFRPEVAGVDVSQAVREPRVNAKVSAIAALPAVRDWVNDELRAAADLHPRGVVADGRDIGTVVFPDAPVKVFLTASPQERAKRRSLQAGSGSAADDLLRVQSDLARRDAADSGRKVAPLVPAADAVVLDTTKMGFEEQVGVIVKLARNAFA
ncbi:MAG: (d)CMP kinase [Gemmatimonadetes bacterium]|nr:(d)CMP kinase [Gemmatimonadota bacterium]